MTGRSHIRTSRSTRHLGAILILAVAVACGTGDKGKSESGATPAETTETPQPGYTELPFSVDSAATSVAVNDKGIYVADFGKGNELDAAGWSLGGADDGRVLLLENGANAQKELVTNVGAPTSVALGPDGSLYVVDVSGGRVLQFANDSTTPVPLPFTTDGPKKVAVNETGDVVLLTDDGIQILPRGASTPTEVKNVVSTGEALAVNREGAVYFTDTFGDVMVVDKGATETREIPGSNSDDEIIAMTFDTNGDHYVISETSTTEKSEGGRRTCTTLDYTVRKFANGSATATDVPVTGLTLPTSISISKGDIYITDNKRVLKLPLQ